MSKRKVYGIGTNDMEQGWISSNQTNARIYDVWRHMLLRTTASYWEKYPSYQGTTVCEEWKLLSNFVNDIIQCEGYELWRDNPNNQIMLDKDTKMLGNKHYCKELCCFLSHLESNRDVHRRHPECARNASQIASALKSKPIRGINLSTGEVTYFSSQADAARSIGVRKAHIWMILSDSPKYVSNQTVSASNGDKWTFEKS